MMLLDVALIWKDLREKDLSRSVVVVADVLRATTVMTVALANGASCVMPQETDVEARRLYADLKAQGQPVLLSGEKEGLKREGYDLGNSPFEFTKSAVENRTIIHLTTNGTRALVAAGSAKEIYIVSFSNLSAVANRLKTMLGKIDSVVFVVSGKEGEYCIEDTVCIGGVIARIIEPPGKDLQITDSARTAVDLYELYTGRLLDMVRQSNHGRYLEEIGLGTDLPECVKVDTTTIVPVMKQGRIVIG